MTPSARATDSILIRGAELPGGSRADVRVRGGVIEALGSLSAVPGDLLVEASGGALLPGLHDHHLHLFSLAAARQSLLCGPPAVHDAAALAVALARRAAAGGGWIRGIGYHESVAGELDRRWLDRQVLEVPVRIQHRSGRLWIFNSAGLARLSAASSANGVACPPVDAESGRLYDADVALREALGAEPPDLGLISRDLAACGVTGVTDMTPDNDRLAFERFCAAQACGELAQRLLLGGRLDMAGGHPGPRVSVGPTKFHLHESALPDFESVRAAIRASHDGARCVAFHCVTEAELVFALAALTEAGSAAGDRIEHASLTPDALLEQIRALGLTVITQPNFVAERGDAYLEDVPRADHPHLYRAGSFLKAGIALAGGSDAPFGTPDPWLAMRAAVDRRTAAGIVLGSAEALTPEQAVALFTGHPDRPAIERKIARGAEADLVLLDRPWDAARGTLSRELVALTVADGSIAYLREDLAGRD